MKLASLKSGRDGQLLVVSVQRQACRDQEFTQAWKPGHGMIRTAPHPAGTDSRYRL